MFSGTIRRDLILAEMGAESYAGVRLDSELDGARAGMFIVHGRPLAATSGTIALLRLFAARASVELERVERERRLRVACESADRANHSKSEFLANMSHEIRTPMSAILGFADLLEEEGDLSLAPQRRVDCIRTIRRNGEHLLAVINDILDMSKIEAGKVAIERIPVGPRDVVQGVFDLLRIRASDAGLYLRLESDAGVPERVLCDPTRLRQILANLVSNGLKFTEAGGVTVRVSFRGRDERLCFAVTDTGIGMSAEQCERVLRFDAFHQVDASVTRRFGGTGLGLRISSALAGLMGGEICATSQPGIGSTFTACVTAAPHAPSSERGGGSRGAPLSDREVAAAQAGEVLAGRRVLVVEDGPDNVRLVRHYLTRVGAVVETAENGEVALGSVADSLARDEPFDLILMDMQMPVLDGYGATRALRARGVVTPIIALTAHALQQDRGRCLEAGCDDYLTKPISRVALLGACVEWLSSAVGRGD